MSRPAPEVKRSHCGSVGRISFTGRELRQIRASLELDDLHVAEEAGVSLDALRKVEQGHEPYEFYRARVEAALYRIIARRQKINAKRLLTAGRSCRVKA